MARAAGSDPFYRFGVINQADQPTGMPAHLWSVTTILDALGKPLTWWGYRLGMLALREALEGPALEIETKKGTEILEPLQLQEVLDPASLGGPIDRNQPVLRLSDDDLYEKIKRRKAITPNTVRDTASGRGTSIHSIVESYFLHHTLPPPEKVAVELHPFVTAFISFVDKWLAHVPHRVILCERPVYSLEHEYCGTCDLLIEVAGVYYCVDFKTSKALYPEALLQPVAYLHAAQEMSERARRTGHPERAYLPDDGRTMDAMVVALHADGTYTAGNASHYGFTFDDFLSVYRAFLLKLRLEEAGDDIKAKVKARKEEAKRAAHTGNGRPGSVGLAQPAGAGATTSGGGVRAGME